MWIMYGAAILAIVTVIWMLIKKMDIKITLFLIGILLMYAAMIIRGSSEALGMESTGIWLLDPLQATADKFKSIIGTSGFVILILGGYSAYMSSIRANDMTVRTLTGMMRGIKSVYLLVPAVFLLGNLLSLVVPSASNLAIILLSTLYPIMRKAGMNPLTAGGVIATTATVMPTPLGSDNVAIAAELAKTEAFAGITASEYVFRYHVLASVPSLLVMAAVHYFWQKHEDKKMSGVQFKSDDVEVQTDEEEMEGKYRVIYSILPLLPVLLLIGSFVFQSVTGVKISVSVEAAVIFSFIVAVLCEIIKEKNIPSVLEHTDTFFKGMGSAMPVVALLVAGTTFVTGLQSIGMIESLQEHMMTLNGQGAGFALPLIMFLLTAVIVILSGSGTALFFAMVPMMIPLAEAAGINVLAISIPMGLAGNILRAVSPFSAVIMIVSGSIGELPTRLVRRTAVPMIAGALFMFIESMIIFL